MSFQQLLIENKLIFNTKTKYYPYLLVGLGVSFNQSENYDINYPADLFFTPLYEDNVQTSFSYSLGLGIDFQVAHELRIGLGYRFTDLGEVALGQRTLDPINPIDIPGTLEQSNVYIQEVMLQFTYGYQS